MTDVLTEAGQEAAAAAWRALVQAMAAYVEAATRAKAASERDMLANTEREQARAQLASTWALYFGEPLPPRDVYD